MNTPLASGTLLQTSPSRKANKKTTPSTTDGFLHQNLVLQVIPAARFPQSNPLDYLVPSTIPIPRVGSLVTIPLAGRKVPGVVWNVIQQPTIPLHRCKPILASLFGGAILFPESVRAACTTLAIHTDCSLPTILLHVLPSLRQKEATLLPDAVDGGAAKSLLTMVSSIADVTLMKKVTLSDHPLLVLVPTNEHAQRMAQIFANRKPIIFTSETPIAQQRERWVSLLNKKTSCLITTRIGAFAPLPKQAEIILVADEQPSHATFEAHPHLDSRLIGFLRSETEKRPLHILTEAPTLASLHWTQKKTLVQRGSVHTVVTDLSAERQSTQRMVHLSTVALTLIEDTLDDGASVCLLINRIADADILHAQETTLPLMETLCRAHFPSAALRVLAPALKTPPQRPTIFLSTSALAASLRPYIASWNIGAIILVSLEQLTQTGHYTDDARAVETLHVLHAIAHDTRATLLLQTRHADSPLLTTITEKPLVLEKKLLAERASLSYPPFFHQLLLEVPREIPEEAVRTLLASLPLPQLHLAKYLDQCYSVTFAAESPWIPNAFATLPQTWRYQVIETNSIAPPSYAKHAPHPHPSQPASTS